MKKLIVSIVSLLILSVGAALAYDKQMAASYEKFFDPFEGKAAAKQAHKMKAPDLVKALKNGDEIFVIDVRTAKETGVYSVTLPNSLVVPIDELFRAENLERIPEKGKVVITCKSGMRATMAATGLRHIGFDNVYVLVGGYQELSKAVNPKTIY
ncbi:MAG: rhodanese-like domain-containing protein [Pseudomonadota bacterium]|nr:rhodanese-like domain-containing protein [Pseudomonadota bacterium]